MDNTRKLKTYLWHGEQCFFVSTIERDSLAMADGPPRRYMETLAWKCDWHKNDRGECVGQSQGHDALDQHFDMVRQLRLKGVYSEEMDDSLL